MTIAYLSTLLYYSFYFFLTVTGILSFFKKKYSKYTLAALIFCAQFNITALFDLGIPICFFEFILFAVFFIFLLHYLSNNPENKISYTEVDKIFFLFIVVSFLSIVVAFVRYTFFDLVISPVYSEHPMVRSLKSSARFIAYFFTIICVRNFLNPKRKYFIVSLALSGIPPAFASFIQTIPGWGIFLYLNNLTHFTIPTWKLYESSITGRSFGLAFESSAFATLLAFSFLGLLEAYRSGYLKKKIYIVLLIIYVISLFPSLSRTGFGLFALIFLLYYYKKMFRGKNIIISLLTIPLIIFFLSTVNFYGHNILQRFLSIFQYNYDLSTYERYSSIITFIKMFLDKSLLFGIGIYNYFYYITDYLPDGFLARFPHHAIPGAKIPSFNFLFELLPEFGGLLFITFFAISYYLYKKIQDSFLKKYLIVILTSFFFGHVFTLIAPFLILFYPYCKRPGRKVPVDMPMGVNNI